MAGAAKKVIWLFDIHGNERDKRALACAQRALEHFKPDITIIGGDLLNNTAFSAHPEQKVGENRKGQLLKHELAWAESFIDWCQEHTRGDTIFCEGNHDAWIERFCASLPAAVADSVQSVLSVESRFTKQGKRKNFKWVPYRNLLGNRKNEYELPHGLVTVHGMSTAKNAAKAHLEKYKYCKSVVFGHTHRYDVQGMQLPDGRYVEAINPGCLCKLRPAYAEGPSDWAHGFLVGYVGRHSYTTYRCKIERGYTVLPSGKEIKAA